MAIPQELQEVVQRILIDKTLSVEALDAVKAIHVDNTKLNSTVVELRSTIENNNGRISALTTELGVFKNLEEQLKARETAVAAREKLMTDLEKKAAVADAISQTFDKCFDKVFRNATINKSVVSNVPVAVEGGNNGCGFVSSHPGSENSSETQS